MSALDLFERVERARSRGALELFDRIERARPSRPQSMFGTPDWYAAKCDALSKAVWRGQLTEFESQQELDFQHELLMVEMTRDKLWRSPRRSTGRARGRKFPARYRGKTCGACSAPLGPFTGLCAACHFRGWWWGA